MDRKINDFFKEYIPHDKDFIFKIGVNTFFKEKEDGVYLIYKPGNDEVIEYKLKELEELYEGEKLFNLVTDADIDYYWPLLESIESAIDETYQDNQELKDKNIKVILERLQQKPEININSKIIKLIQNNLKVCLSFNIYSKKEVKGAFKRILKSLKYHHQIDGPTGYLDFLKHRFDK